MFLQASVILLTGGCLVPRGCLVLGGSALGGAWSWGVCSQGVPGPGGSAPGGCLVLGGLVETPPDGHCCAWYASYWNAFLFVARITKFPTVFVELIPEFRQIQARGQAILQKVTLFK